MQAKDNKMEHIGKIVAYLILAINAFFVGTLILSAYSPYLNPKLNPLSSGLGLAFPLFLVINIAFIMGRKRYSSMKWMQKEMFMIY